MERELWSWLMRAIHSTSRSVKRSNYHTHSTATIVRVYLWAQGNRILARSSGHEDLEHVVVVPSTLEAFGFDADFCALLSFEQVQRPATQA